MMSEKQIADYARAIDQGMQRVREVAEAEHRHSFVWTQDITAVTTDPPAGAKCQCGLTWGEFVMLENPVGKSC